MIKYYIVWGESYVKVQSSIMEVDGNIDGKEDINFIMDKIKKDNNITNVVLLNIIKLPL